MGLAESGFDGDDGAPTDPTGISFDFASVSGRFSAVLHRCTAVSRVFFVCVCAFLGRRRHSSRYRSHAKFPHTKLVLFISVFSRPVIQVGFSILEIGLCIHHCHRFARVRELNIAEKQ